MASSSLAQALAGFVEAARQGRSVVVASDFDGVLAPLVLNPADSAPLPGTIEALTAMGKASGVTAAIVSGRDLETLRRLTVAQDDAITLIGSHGVEWSSGTDSSAELSPAQRSSLEGAASALNDVIARHPDARIEHKPAGVVLHTRGIDDAEAAAATEEALAIPHDVPGVAAMKGKSVVELTVLTASKGSALTRLAAAKGDAAVLYLGDDVTDETAFKALPVAEGHVTIKVGEGESAAGYRVDGPADAADVLIGLAAQLNGH